MQVYVGVDGEDREVLCDVEGAYELVAVDEKEQYLVEDFWNGPPSKEHEDMIAAIDVAAAVERKELAELQAESMRDDRVFNRLTNGGF